MRSSDVDDGRAGLAAVRARVAARRSRQGWLAANLAVAIAWWWTVPGLVLAASPAPTTVPAGDPRSSGQGPGLVGDPMTAILVVVGIAALAVVATLLYVRATGGPSRDRSGR